jgi:hypothetical protein
LSVRRSPEDTRPEFRSLRIYAIDPMVARAGEHQATVQIRFEDLPLRDRKVEGIEPLSFFGRRVEVVDVDAASATPVWMRPVDLDDSSIAMQHGLDPSESDPQFHQQMVHAVAMRTLEQFDRALGRVVYFSGRRRLRLVPHAFRGANAFYHPKLRAVLFGYFRASKDAPGDNLPGQVIFTCLSHDIIAHEITHAIVDRLRPSFNVATNPQVRAFHEGFADIVAIFQRLTFRDLVRRALQDSRGKLRGSQLLSDIAVQFGQGLGSGKSLRTALDGTTRIQDVSEEHSLGAVLVAAVFEGFAEAFERRTADLVRIATGGTGELPTGALHPDLVERLTGECIRTAQSVLTMCIRAFDYLPPADVTFGAFLRALVTADWELNPLDEVGLRAAMIEAFRRRGIFAVEAGSLAVSALLLDVTRSTEWQRYEGTFRAWVDLAIRMDLEEQRADTPDDSVDSYLELLVSSRVSSQQAPPVRSDSAETEEELPAGSELRTAIFSWFAALSPEDRQRLGLLPDTNLKYPHFHSSRRVTTDGRMRFGLVVQLLQPQPFAMAGASGEFPCGVTLVIDVTGRVRFVIATRDLKSSQEQMENTAKLAMTTPMGWESDQLAADPFAVDYRGMHEART